MRCIRLLQVLTLVWASPTFSEVEAEIRLNYGIIFDAGSSGSRIHIYTWRRGGDAGEFDLVEDDLVKVKPGLSSFRNDPSKAGASLATLLAHAQAKIPQEHQSSTPVFLMATAGLRFVGETTAAEILQSVSDTLSASPFLFRQGWAYIMPGYDEGLFGWVAINYLLGALHNATLPTSGVIDLGGGSVQLVFNAPSEAGLPREYAGNFGFGGRKHNLYIKSHLGFGLDRARDRVTERLVQQGSLRHGAIEHPCMPAGLKIDIKAGRSEEHLFVGTGAYDACVALYSDLFDKNANCNVAPCSFNGAHQPELPSAIFGFSYLFDRTRAIGLLDRDVQMFGTQHMTLSDIREASVELCSSEPSLLQERFAGCEDADKWANFCGDTVYMIVLLEHGFGISPSTLLTMGNKVAGVELVWTLGAIIAKSAELPRILADADRKNEL